jgi:hypothetical protein
LTIVYAISGSSYGEAYEESAISLSVGQVFGHHQLEHLIPEHMRILPIVKPELQFIQVGVKVLCANLMIRAHNAPA